ncbi:MAG: NAD(P)-binding protein, partial [Bradymonadaceae bacterium]
MNRSSYESPPAIVVGSGFGGLAAAIRLRAMGHPVTVLEADPQDRERPGSRAIYVHGATLRILERLSPGLGQSLADDGLVWPTRRTYWRGREVFSRTYD